jgi:two-component system, cell cycle sensor histidine kinase and response regulator CckA
MIRNMHHASGATKNRDNDEQKRLQQVNADLRARLREDDFELPRVREHLLSIFEDQKKMEEQLRQAVKMESINTMARSIAHDFNNFLTVILGCTTMMKDEVGDRDKLEEEINTIQHTVEKAASLVQQLNRVGQQPKINLRLTNVNSWLNDIAKWVKNILPKRITLTLDLDSSFPHILADVSQLNQLLLNLCVNAKDAIGNSGAIRLATKTMVGTDLQGRFPEIKEQRYVCISVADTGDGMDEKTRERIFEPFFTTKAREKGTGLGLSICYRIVKSHAGFVDVESEPGHGTTFYIYLPVKHQI